MSDRIAVMSRGQVEQIGTPEEIYAAPASIFVAGFIGSANLLPGTLEAVDDGARDRAPRQRRAPSRSPAATRRPCRRPGHGDAPAGAPERRRPAGERRRRSLGGVVENVIFQGSERRLIVHLADGTEVVATIDADDDAAAARAQATRSRCAGRPTRRTCCAVARRSSARRRPTSTRCRRRSTARRSSAGAGDAPSAPPERRFGRRALIAGGAVAGAAVIVGGVLALTGDGGERRRGRLSAGGDGRHRHRRQRGPDPQLAGLHRPDRGRRRRHARPLHRGDRHRRHLRRGLQRQQRGLQPDPRARARHRRGHRLRHHLPDQLDGGPAQEARLDRAAAARPDPQPGQPRGPLPQPGVGLRGGLPPAVAGRDHRHRLRPGAHRPRAAQHHGPVRPRVQRPGGDALGDARHPRAGRCSASGTTRASSTRRAPSRRST